MAKHDHLHTLDIQTKYDERLWEALNLAAAAHQDQKRKNFDEWYITHPFRVMEYVRGVTDDVDVQVAAVLHDTVEDTEMTIEMIERGWGARIAFYVWGVTKDDTIPDWRARNEAYLARLEREADDNSVIIALADKIANIEDQIRDFRLLGESMWARFKAGPDDQLWWFTAVLDVARRRLGAHPLIDLLADRLSIYQEQVIGRS
jgi:(p)ppGpp synthase/HD superfamily hydrolase